MDYQNDIEAFCIANTYGFSPPRRSGPARLRRVDSGKYESDCMQGQPTRSMIFAHWQDHTNILIQYHPADLEPP